MKKRIIALLLVVTLLFSFPIIVSAETRTSCINPTLTFGSNTVFCDVVICADPGDTITAKISLYEGGNCIKTWNRTATELLIFGEYATAMNGYRYTMKVEATINGIKEPTVTIHDTYVQ